MSFKDLYMDNLQDVVTSVIKDYTFHWDIETERVLCVYLKYILT